MLLKGDQLRQVIIPRLPFRVPTEPVQQARFERLEAQGLDPFRAYSLPQAVLRFRQGFGRLIRTKNDKGIVLLLDRRVTNQWYGRVFLASLPDVLRAQGPTRGGSAAGGGPAKEEWGVEEVVGVRVNGKRCEYLLRRVTFLPCDH